MTKNRLRMMFVSLCFSVCFVAQSVGQESSDHIKVALRTVGHKLLLASGDSTSRVLPIKYKSERFIINFEEEFDFTPFDLYTTVEQTFSKTKVNQAYRLEVFDNDEKEVVYSYESNPSEDSLLTCGPRKQPRANYSLLVSFLDDQGQLMVFNDDPIETIDELTVPEKLSSSSGIISILIVLGLLLVAGISFMIFRNRKKEDSDLTYIGKYQFDQRNMKLIFKQESIELTSKESDLLTLLHSSMDQTIEREIILNVVWGDEGDYVGRTLDVFISKLRKKFSGDENVKIVNVRGVGYKLMLSKLD
jgi:hypothetical protein